jgi:septum formation protein
MQPGDSPRELILASASPRRRMLLEQIGVRVKVLPVEIDESVQEGEDPVAYVQRLALAKARAGWALAEQREWSEPVLGADTAVVIDGRILGKPCDLAEARAMLGRLSGHCHHVMSAVALVQATRQSVKLSISEVCFRVISATERDAYWRTGEGCDKAGAYAVQGAGAVFVERLTGSYTGVVGLPLFETHQLIAEFDIPYWQYPGQERS